MEEIRTIVGFIFLLVGAFMIVYADPLYKSVNQKRAAFKSVIGLVWFILGLQLILK